MTATAQTFETEPSIKDEMSSDSPTVTEADVAAEIRIMRAVETQNNGPAIILGFVVLVSKDGVKMIIDKMC